MVTLKNEQYALGSFGTETLCEVGFLTVTSKTNLLMLNYKLKHYDDDNIQS